MTEAEFIDSVAETLGLLAAGQSLANEDAAVIRRRSAAVFARLAREELTSVADPDDVPAAEALALADIVAFACAVPFGLTGPKLQELAAGAGTARETLRLVRSERPYRDTLGLTRWWGSRRGTVRVA
ncbi:MAG: hypothetical protein IT534_02105 [Bauldia sp.]|nr:hypothetical protein [Bauldia sp.]